MTIHQTLGQNVKHFRKAKKWSQEELAERTGLHRTYVSGIERGIRNPTLQIVESLAKALNTTTARLMRNGDNEK